jgi:hypothetical protein
MAACSTRTKPLADTIAKPPCPVADMTMISLQLELVLLCRGCNAPVALNSVVTSLACDRCQRTATLTDDDWRTILDGAREAAGTMIENEERDLSFDAGPGRIRRTVRRAAPRCSACRTAFPPEAIDTGVNFACTGCGREALSRRLPAFPAIGLFGEDRGLLDGVTASVAPIPLPCAACAASLEVDGSNRVVVCRYCGGSSHLPDAVWARLHPLRPVAPFYAFFESAPAAAASFTWESVKDVVADAAGNLYLIGTLPGDVAHQHNPMICSLDPQLALRWLRREIRGDRIGLFGERLLVWGEDPTRFVACDDGRSLDDAFPLSREDVKRFYPGRDGTILRLGIFGLTRHSPDGTLVDLHPDKSPLTKLADVFRRNRFANVGIATLLADNAIAALAVRSSKTVASWVVLVVVDASTGTSRIDRPVEVDRDSLMFGSLQGDSHGRILFLDPKRHQIRRFDAETSSVILQADFLDRNAHLAVLPNDEMWIVSDDGAARRIAPDGRLLSG